MAALRDRLERELLGIDATGLNGGGAPRVPNTTNIYFDCIEGEALVIALDLKGLAVSTGAACSSGAIEPSHVLTAMGLRPDRARASIRFSLGKQSTAEEVEFASCSCRKQWRGCGSCRRCIKLRAPSLELRAPNEPASRKDLLEARSP